MTSNKDRKPKGSFKLFPRGARKAAADNAAAQKAANEQAAASAAAKAAAAKANQEALAKQAAADAAAQRNEPGSGGQKALGGSTGTKPQVPVDSNVKASMNQTPSGRPDASAMPPTVRARNANGQGNGAEIIYGWQSTVNGNRSGCLFPLLGRYTNSDTNAKTIAISVRRDSADDYFNYDWSSTSVWMRITEIAR